jgi:hypothetical protein
MCGDDWWQWPMPPAQNPSFVMIGWPKTVIRSNIQYYCSNVQPSVKFSHRNWNQGVHLEFSVHPPSPLNTNSYVWEENLGSTRKFVQNYLLFTCISNLLPAIHMQSVNGLEELEEPFAPRMGWRNLSKKCGKKFLQPMHSGCICLSVCHSVCL